MSYRHHQIKMLTLMTAALIFVAAWAVTAYARNAADYQNSQRLYKRVTEGEADVVKQLLDEDTSPELFVSGGKGRIGLADFKGKRLGPDARTPLMWAAENGKPDMVKVLLEGNAKPDAQTIIKETALIFAVIADDLESVKLLVRHKANINIKNKYKWTPLMIAVSNGNDPIIEVLKQAGARENRKQLEQARFIRAIIQGDTATVGALLDKKMSVKTTSRQGYPAIFVAVENKQHEVVKLLLDRGADKNSKDPFNGLTPLMSTVARGDSKTTTLLLDAGASLTKTNKHDADALQMALLNNQFETAKLLIDKGADPNRANGKRKLTALMQVAFSGNTDAVRFLIESGADASITVDGMTALDYARKAKNSDKVIALLETYEAGKDFQPIPGETIGSLLLQKDTQKQLISSDRIADPECQQRKIIDTEVVNSPKDKSGSWTEKWHIDRCAEIVTYDVTYKSDGKGGTYIEIPMKVKRNNSK